MQAYWKQACLNLTATGLVNGCGADASQQTAAYIPNLAPATATAWTAGHVAAVRATTVAVEETDGLVLCKVCS